MEELTGVAMAIGYLAFAGFLIWTCEPIAVVIGVGLLVAIPVLAVMAAYES